MGIDYYSCERCGEGFPDVIDYVYCECGNVMEFLIAERTLK